MIVIQIQIKIFFLLIIISYFIYYHNLL